MKTKIILVVLVIVATLTECIVMRKSREYDAADNIAWLETKPCVIENRIIARGFPDIADDNNQIPPFRQVIKIDIFKSQKIEKLIDDSVPGIDKSFQRIAGHNPGNQIGQKQNGLRYPEHSSAHIVQHNRNGHRNNQSKYDKKRIHDQCIARHTKRIIGFEEKFKVF